ncbi:MAG: hypothetical protein GXP62_07750 [Oligoflexia bacterium]|nr:hypothetical protein [Oligoflexia bacterium]
MDLVSRTLSALDWPVVLDALSRHARTQRGARAAKAPDLVGDLIAVRQRYAAVAEVGRLEATGERVPIGAVSDIQALLSRAVRGSTLEGEDLRSVSQCLLALRHLRRWVDEQEDDIPALRILVLPIDVDAELCDTLDRSFDDTGKLSEREYPELGALRRAAERLRARIQQTLDEILSGNALGGVLQDRYVTQRDGRFVIPVRADRRRGLGIVHGRSQSGETVFVEPAAVVELHNELSQAESELIAETSRILSVLSHMLGRFGAPLADALLAAEQVDLAVARCGLGKELKGVLPKVADQGVIDLRQVRHPVLALRGIDVVANDLRLDGEVPGLVLSGPNTGGKTVALKALGLVALMVRSGIPVPALEGSRVDLFTPVVADIGDWQSVEGDLSTFSGHVAVLKAMLVAAAQTQGSPALVLLDEVGMGTDPAQGAALARAVLETLVQGDARVAATTHFTELKALAAVDPRFQVAAVTIEDGRPTYRVQLGAAGESHALAIAQGLALPQAVVDRARQLLSSTQREVSDLVSRLEDERSALAHQVREQAAERQALHDQLAELQARESRLEDRSRQLERTVSERFQAGLRDRERDLKQLIATLQANPDLRRAGRTLEQIRALSAAAQVAPPGPAPSGPPPTSLAVGDAVVVRSLHRKARVLRLLKGDRVEVQAGVMKMKVARADLEGTRGERIVVPSPRPVAPVAPAPPSSLGKLRVQANTCDLRGQRVVDALEQVDRFLAELGGSDFDVGWILHGHGTGALKQAVRRHLPSRREIKRWKPADTSDGGDAFTMVELG